MDKTYLTYIAHNILKSSPVMFLQASSCLLLVDCHKSLGSKKKRNVVYCIIHYEPQIWFNCLTTLPLWHWEDKERYIDRYRGSGKEHAWERESVCK